MISTFRMERITFRVNKEEKKILEELLESENCKDMSTLIRKKLFNYCNDSNDNDIEEDAS